MENNASLVADELAVALTKPATKMGVPFSAFYLSILVVFFSWMLYQLVSGAAHLMGIVFFLGLWLVMYVCLYAITSKDIFGLALLWINLRHFRKPTHHAVWGNRDVYVP